MTEVPPALRTLLSAFEMVPLVGVLRRCPPEHAVAMARAAHDAGFRAIEVTMESERATWQLAAIRDALPESAVVGAGTVTTLADVSTACNAGAAFLVAPNCEPSVIREAHRHDAVMVPGVMTPTELLTARRCGASLAKLFPAGALGPAYLRTLRGPVPDVKLIATGGIGPGSLREFLTAGALAVGVGSELFLASALRVGDAEAVAAMARGLIAEAADVRALAGLEVEGGNAP